jgi:hypothetical protein
MFSSERSAGPMARRLTTNQEIAGSIPASINILQDQFFFATVSPTIKSQPDGCDGIDMRMRCLTVIRGVVFTFQNGPTGSMLMLRRCKRLMCLHPDKGHSMITARLSFLVSSEGETVGVPAAASTRHIRPWHTWIQWLASLSRTLSSLFRISYQTSLEVATRC